MKARVAVVDPLPMYQHGIAAVLAAVGHTVDMPDDVLAWARHTLRTVVILTLLSEGDWALLEQLRNLASTFAVIALIPEESTPLGIRAVCAGARSVLAREVTAGALRRCLEATIDGQAVLPAAIATALALAGPAHPAPALTPQALTADHASWLRHLARGATVAQLAVRAGYSERAMYRLLRLLYTRLGVRNRVEAILWAQQRGLLTDPPVL